MRRFELQPLVGVVRDQLRDRPEFRIAVHEGLRRHEATGEADVELSGKRLASKLDPRLLRIAVTQFVSGIHEDGRDPRDELTVKIGVAREMYPAKFLDRREHGR